MHILHMHWRHFLWVHHGHIVWWAMWVSIGCCLLLLALMLTWAWHCFKTGHRNGGALLLWFAVPVALLGYWAWYVVGVIVAAIVGLIVIIWLGFGILSTAGGSYGGGDRSSPSERMYRQEDVRRGVDRALRDAERRDSGWFG